MECAVNIDPNAFKSYYENVFPYDLIYELFFKSKRECRLQTSNKGWIKMNNINSEEKLRNEITSHVTTSIHLNNYVEIAYNSDSHRAGGKIERELTIDVDLSDYPITTRTCCTNEKKLCSSCWPLLQFTVNLLKYFLEEIFGFKKVFFFFSGRRGIQCIVFDKNAYELRKLERNRLLQFMSISNLTSNTSYLQEIWSSFGEASWKEISELLHLSLPVDSKDTIHEVCHKKLSIMWPKFDMKVTTDLNHNFRCPYSLHTETGMPMYHINTNDIKFPPERILSDYTFIQKNIEQFKLHYKQQC